MIDHADELALLVASGLTVRQAAKQLGISEATAYRRSEKPDFKQRVAEIRSEALSASVGRLSALVADAVGALEAILRNGSDRDRLAASRTVLGSVAPMMELSELRQRIDALEQRGLKLHG
jgi:transposase